MTADLALLLPELTLIGAIVLALIAEMLRAPRSALGLMLVGLLLAAGFTVPVLHADATVFSGTYRVDLLSGWAKLILLPGAGLTLLLARAELAGLHREGTAYVLLGLVTVGALLLAGAGDIMVVVLGVLLSGLGSFALVALPQDDPSTEASLKFFVFASVAGAVMIYGLSFWFGASGTTLLAELPRLAEHPVAAAVGLVGLVIGLGYKASLVPFHFWAPDAYDGAPVSVAAFLSVVPKIGAIFGLAQVVRDLPTTTGWVLILAAVSALTMTYGYLAALVQDNVVRLLAYSSIAQAGYFLLGVVAIGRSELALPSLVLFGAAYTVMNVGAFAVVLAIGRRLDDFVGLGRRRPILGLAMVVLLLSLTGIPPLFGFPGKALLFGASMQAGLVWLAVVAVINSVVSLAVYLRVVVPMYRAADTDAETDAHTDRPSQPLVVLVWSLCAGATLVLGITAQWFLGALT